MRYINENIQLIRYKMSYLGLYKEFIWLNQFKDNVYVSFKSTDVQLLLWFTTFNQLTTFNSTDICNQSTGLGCFFKGLD